MIKNIIKRNIKKIIKPVNGKVDDRYYKYAFYSFVTNTCLSVENTLSMHSMLSVMGSIKNEYLVSQNFIGKDMMGQLGGLYTINKMGKYGDKNKKKFITRGLLYQQVSIIGEMLTPILPFNMFLPVTVSTTIGKNVSFAILGGVNASILRELSSDENVAEIYSKMTIVNTVASSLGMGIGLSLSYYIPSHTMRLLLLPFVSGLKLYSYKKCVEEFID